MAIRMFTSAAWGGSGDAVDCGIVDGVQTYKYLTIDQAIAACQDGDFVTEDTTSAAFLDAGFPLQTITIPMGGSLIVNAAITLYGTRSRIRLDGVGSYRVALIADASFTDVDFTRLNGATSNPLTIRASVTFTRALIVGCACGAWLNTILIQNGAAAFYDCALYGNANRASKRDLQYSGTYAFTARRSVGGFVSGDAQDCIDLYNLPQAQVDAIGFVKPPKVYDNNNPGYYTDGTTWTNTDWQNVDLRLLSTSQYATGGTSVTSAATVYDLAGIKRKVGGARGAYECLSDVDRWFCYLAPIWFRVTRDDDGPDVAVWRNTVETPIGVRAVVTPKFAYQTWNGNAWSGAAYNTVNKTIIADQTVRFANAPNNVITGGWTVVETSSTPRDGFSPVDVFTGNQIAYFSSWRANPQRTTSASASSSSVCLIDANAAFRSTASTVSKIYVAGWTTADLGDLTAEVELGKGATVKTSGKITITGVTDTSANLLNRVQLRDAAELTLKNCVISD